MSVHTAKLSIIIPAYNEAARIGKTVRVLAAYRDRHDFAVEILVVDDGSTDQTEEAARSGDVSVRVLRYPENRGKGYATRLGLSESGGEFCLVYDADGSTPIEQMDAVWRELDDGADIVFGSRSHADSRIEVRQPLYRELMGRIYNLILRLLGLTRSRDTQCGFKVFRAEAAERILPLMRCDGFGADCELLYIADVLGMDAREIPVTWVNSQDSRVHPIFHSIEMLGEVIGVRVRAWRGAYRLTSASRESR